MKKWKKVTLTFDLVTQQEMCLSETQCPLLRRFEIKFRYVIWLVLKLSPFAAYYFPWILFFNLLP